MYIKEENTEPLVSVIMPAYNAEQFIAEAISSVIAQSVSDWELIVVDDNSQDGTCQIVTEMMGKDSRIQLIVNEENVGAARTRNRGLEMCRGRYVALLDSDDYWYPQFLEKLVYCANKTNADICYCSYSLIDESGNPVCNDFIVPEQTDFQQSMIRSVISCSTVLLTKQIAQNHRFPVDVYHEDIALWFTLLRDGAVARGVPEVLAAYRQRENSRAANKLTSACRRWVIYRKHLKLPFAQSIKLMIQYAYYGVIKYKRI
mgnify:CR=1 FL=1